MPASRAGQPKRSLNLNSILLLRAKRRCTSRCSLAVCAALSTSHAFGTSGNASPGSLYQVCTRLLLPGAVLTLPRKVPPERKPGRKTWITSPGSTSTLGTKLSPMSKSASELRSLSNLGRRVVLQRSRSPWQSRSWLWSRSRSDTRYRHRSFVGTKEGGSCGTQHHGCRSHGVACCALN
jgi:hypothetical protein